MSFEFIDLIEDVEPGVVLTATKCVSRGETYLQDHFPMFPVLPGVLMLESMFQAAAWLVRVTEDFGPSMVVLEEASQLKYSGLVKPGETLRIVAEMKERAGATYHFKTSGTVVASGVGVVSARLRLRAYTLAEEDPAQEPLDRHLQNEFRREWASLYLSRAPRSLVKS